ncbi:MAG: hypothetical protein M3Y08_12455 [Fibrobacterota bacterium]|nr:hypothetical protein [Fibrobacterota bacterium]
MITEGKCESEYRDLKRKFEITLVQKNSNFEVRFYRLVDKLDSEPIGCALRRPGEDDFA